MAGAAAGPGTHPRVAARHAARHLLLVLVAVEAQGGGAVALEGSAGLAHVQVGALNAAATDAAAEVLCMERERAMAEAL